MISPTTNLSSPSSAVAAARLDTGEPDPWSPAGRLLATQRTFAAAMGKARSGPPKPGQGDADRARDAAEQLVTQTFVQPMLKQLRESSQAAPPFAPNPA